MKQIIIQELKSPGCQICKRFEAFWEKIKGEFPNVKMEIVDVTTPQGQELAKKHLIFASPGIIINGELFASGGYNEEKFIAKLKELGGN